MPKRNLRTDVEDSAPKFDMPDEMQARFGRTAIGGETLGVSHIKLEPNRIPSGTSTETGRRSTSSSAARRGSRSTTRSSSSASWTRSASTRARCARSRRARTASSTSPSARAPIPATRRWSRAGGRISSVAPSGDNQGRLRDLPDCGESLTAATLWGSSQGSLMSDLTDTPTVDSGARRLVRVNEGRLLAASPPARSLLRGQPDHLPDRVRGAALVGGAGILLYSSLRSSSPPRGRTSRSPRRSAAPRPAVLLIGLAIAAVCAISIASSPGRDWGWPLSGPTVGSCSSSWPRLHPLDVSKRDRVAGHDPRPAAPDAVALPPRRSGAPRRRRLSSRCDVLDVSTSRSTSCSPTGSSSQRRADRDGAFPRGGARPARARAPRRRRRGAPANSAGVGDEVGTFAGTAPDGLRGVRRQDRRLLRSTSPTSAIAPGGTRSTSTAGSAT